MTQSAQKKIVESEEPQKGERTRLVLQRAKKQMINFSLSEEIDLSQPIGNLGTSFISIEVIDFEQHPRFGLNAVLGIRAVDGVNIMRAEAGANVYDINVQEHDGELKYILDMPEEEEDLELQLGDINEKIIMIEDLMERSKLNRDRAMLKGYRHRTHSQHGHYQIMREDKREMDKQKKLLLNRRRDVLLALSSKIFKSKRNSKEILFSKNFINFTREKIDSQLFAKIVELADAQTLTGKEFVFEEDAGEKSG